MPRRQRTQFTKRSSLSSAARDWLDGKPCGFFEFKSQDELQAVWAAYGDEENMFWRSRYCLPITREELEEHEDAWLNSGDDEEYKFYFINNQYTDDEKLELWNARGDKKHFRWVPGLRRPEAI